MAGSYTRTRSKKIYIWMIIGVIIVMWLGWQIIFLLRMRQDNKARPEPIALQAPVEGSQTPLVDGADSIPFTEDNPLDLKTRLECIRMAEQNGGHGPEKPVTQDYINKHAGILTVITHMGNFDIRLRPDAAPATVKAFLDSLPNQFRDAPYYIPSTIENPFPGDAAPLPPSFHARMNATCYRGHLHFLLQCGPRSGKSGPPLPLEYLTHRRIPHFRGTVGIARGGPRKEGRDTWYVGVRDSKSLGGTVFGHVVEGMEVVDQIMNLEGEPHGNTRYLVDPPRYEFRWSPDLHPPSAWGPVDSESLSDSSSN